MFSVTENNLPPDALLHSYAQEGGYIDCYSFSVNAVVSQVDYIYAFYTSPLFKLERFILKLSVNKPSTDEQARGLADGRLNSFSAWLVEKRTDNQLLLSDYRGRTRSWLMTEPLANKSGTRLYFGSAIVPRISGSGKPSIGFAFKAALGAHKVYSKALLRSAASCLNGE